MTFTESVSTCFQKYADFQGRATRSELWWFVGFQVLIGVGVGLTGAMLGWTEEVSSVVSGVADLALLLPNASVTARRLHDVGKSGWWMFIPLTIVGIVPYLYWLCKPGNPDTNEYGPAPNMGVASAALVPQHV